MLLSAALIVKNEERLLPQCLQSLHGIVDEVVVADTGSTDRSREIAKAQGARVHDFAWADDFAAARNHALDLARGEWILYIDADERIRPCARSALRRHLSNPATVASTVLLYPRPGFTPYRELRLFRNDPGIRFRGIIHENIWPGITDHLFRHGGRIGRSDLVLDHDGYEGDQHAKHLRNLPLLQRAVREDPGRVFNWCHLASIHLALGQDDLAEHCWQEALDQVRRKRRLLTLAEDSLPYIGLVQRGLARGRDVEDILTEALRKFPRNLQLLWLHGKFLAGAARFAEAISVFERIIAAGHRGDFDDSMAYDIRLFTEFAYGAIAACHFKLGKYPEARQAFESAARCDPDRLEYRVKAALCERLAAARSGRSERRATESPVAVERERPRVVRDGG